MKKFIILFLLYFSCTFAQEGGSPFSGFGLGIVDFTSTVRYLGMGGTNLAFSDENEINSFNPVSWSRIKLSSFSAGAYLLNSTITDNNSSNSYNRFNFTQSFIGIPLDKENHMTLGLGIRPVSKINYYILRNQLLDNSLVSVNYQGNGGLSEAVFGLTYQPIKDVDLGVKTGYYFGEIQQNLLIDQSKTDNYNIEIDRSIFMKGFNYTFSMSYSGLGKLLNIPVGNIALLINPGVNINGRQEGIQKFLNGESTVSLDTTDFSSGDVKIPSTFGIGICFSPFSQLLLGIDYTTQSWSNFEMFGYKPAQMQDQSRISVGIEYSPDYDYSSSFFQKMILRFGLYSTNLSYKVAGNAVNEYGVTFGFGIPVSPISILNTSIQYGQRGSKEKNLMLDRFFKINFSLSISELWFVNPDEE